MGKLAGFLRPTVRFLKGGIPRSHHVRLKDHGDQGPEIVIAALFVSFRLPRLRAVLKDEMGQTVREVRIRTRGEGASFDSECL